jgi:hypothetical protein
MNKVLDLETADIRLTNPYRGLEPFSEADADFFFGRKQETLRLKTNLRVSRLTLLHGPTGVGKTSVLRAGVVRELRDEAKRNRRMLGVPQLAVTVFDAWHDDPLAALIQEVRRSTAEACGTPLPDAMAEARDLSATLLACAQALEEEGEAGEFFLILDQFEQFFLYHTVTRTPGSIAMELARAINDPRVPVNVLISIREDWFARLDAFKGSVNGLFDHILRIDFLDREAAREAIEGPVCKYNELLRKATNMIPPAAAPVRIEGADQEETKANLVLRILDDPDLVAGRNPFTEAVLPGGEELGAHAVRPDGIATPFLQLVLTRLWEEDIIRHGERTGHMLTLDTFRGLEFAKGIIRKHVGTVMGSLTLEEQEVAAQVVPFLMHPEGPKIAASAEALARSATLLGDSRGELSADAVSAVLGQLASRESGILRIVSPPPGRPNVARYEVLHDVLGQALLDWLQGYLAVRREASIRREEEEKRAVQQREDAARLQWARWTRVTLAALLLFSVLAGIYLVRAEIRTRQAEQVIWQERELLLLAQAESDRMQASLDSARATLLATLNTTGSSTDGAQEQRASDVVLAVDSLNQLTIRPDDGTRSSVTVRYFPRDADGDGIERLLRDLGYRLEPGPARVQGIPTNAIAFGPGVRHRDVRAVAYALIAGGIAIRRIEAFQVPRGRTHVIEVYTSSQAQNSPPLTVGQISALFKDE